MFPYKLVVATGDYLLAGTFSKIFVTLVGTQGQSPKHCLNNLGRDFVRGAVDEYDVVCEEDLGPILVVHVHKEPYLFFPPDGWYCSYIKVKAPKGEEYHFPCYRWLEDTGTWSLREGTGKRITDDSGNQFLLELREQELGKKRELYRWDEYAPGWPKCHYVDNVDKLDSNSRYHSQMKMVFKARGAKSEIEVRLKGLSGLRESWKSLEDIHRIFWFHKTPVSEYVAEHWLEDSFFGYQFLNAVHPTILRKCTKIPSNFPVTPEMVDGCLGGSTTLQEELKKGNIFIIDFKILEGISTCKLDGIQQYVSAPLCLFHLNAQGEMKPVAIQISQTPGPECPIFLPTDSKWDWTLAKIWVKASNFYVHEVNTHLLEAHFIGEVYAMATHRQLPSCHPIYKLLYPHMSFIFHINAIARISLINSGGFLDTATGIGRQGMLELAAKGTASCTYTSLCLPDDLQERGVTSLPNFYYMEDGMKIWAAIEKFVFAIVGFYYKSNAEVKDDSEIQAWIHEIFIEAFQGNKSSGIPSTMESRAELVKFLTMIIYCGSVRHAAVNSGQFDFAAWMPNTPSTLRQPPPKVKGTATLESILDTLPDIGSTCSLLVILSIVSYRLDDMRKLGYYPEEHFTEEEPKRHIAAFQERLEVISKIIDERNKKVPLVYNYINPSMVENSVAV